MLRHFTLKSLRARTQFSVWCWHAQWDMRLERIYSGRSRLWREPSLVPSSSPWLVNNKHLLRARHYPRGWGSSNNELGPYSPVCMITSVLESKQAHRCGCLACVLKGTHGTEPHTQTRERFGGQLPSWDFEKVLVVAWVSEYLGWSLPAEIPEDWRCLPLN